MHLIHQFVFSLKRSTIFQSFVWVCMWSCNAVQWCMRHENNYRRQKHQIDMRVMVMEAGLTFAHVLMMIFRLNLNETTISQCKQSQKHKYLFIDIFMTLIQYLNIYIFIYVNNYWYIYEYIYIYTHIYQWRNKYWNLSIFCYLYSNICVYKLVYLYIHICI